MVLPIKLRKIWSVKLGTNIVSLAFSKDVHGFLAVAPNIFNAHILDKNGKLIKRIDAIDHIINVSYCCDRFGFIGFDDRAYIYDLSTRKVEKVYVGKSYHSAITMLKDGFLAGWERLAYFDFKGNKKWDMYVPYVMNGPAVYRRHFFIPRYKFFSSEGRNGLVIFRQSFYGSEIKNIDFDEAVWSVRVCDNYLAVGTEHHVFLYDITNPMNPRKIWSFDEIASGCKGICYGAYNVAFGPKCRHLVASDYNDKKIRILDVQTGKQVLELGFEEKVYSVDWWRNRIAVGLRMGIVHMFEIQTLAPSERLSVRKMLFERDEGDIVQIEVD